MFEAPVLLPFPTNTLTIIANVNQTLFICQIIYCHYVIYISAHLLHPFVIVIHCAFLLPLCIHFTVK